MIDIEKPMLAQSITIKELEDLVVNNEVMLQAKYDGIRAAVYPDGKVYSRSGKLLPGQHRYEGFPTYPNSVIEMECCSDDKSFQRATSIFMSHDKPFDLVTFRMFDIWSPERRDELYFDRWERLMIYFAGKEWVKHYGFNLQVPDCIQISPRLDRAIEVYEQAVEAGHEGIVIKRNLPYKHGRSTSYELARFIPTVTAEVDVLGVVPLERNHNKQERDEFGHAKRSTSKAGKVQEDLCGALLVSWEKKELKVGTGFTDDQRREFWRNPPRRIEITYKPVGMKDLPRQPVFKRDITQGVQE